MSRGSSPDRMREIIRARKARPLTPSEQVQDVLQRLAKMPEGTHGAHAVDLLIADGALFSDLTTVDPKRARRLFQQRVGQMVRKAA